MMIKRLMLLNESCKHVVRLRASSSILKCPSTAYQMTFVRAKSNDTSQENLFEAINAPSSSFVDNMASSTTSGSFLDQVPFIQALADGLASIHELGIFEWSTTILLTGLSFRLFIGLPNKIYQERNQAKLANAQVVIIKRVNEQMKNQRLTMNLTTNKLLYNRNVRKIRDEVYAEYDCSPVKSAIASLLQLPIWISISAAIRMLCYGSNNHWLEMEQLKSESFLWLPSLSMPDPTCCISLAFFSFSMLNIAYYVLKTSHPSIKTKISYKIKKYGAICLISAISYMSLYMPAAIPMFWLTSTTFNLFEMILLESIRVRRFFRIPESLLDNEKVYSIRYKHALDRLDLVSARMQQLVNKVVESKESKASAVKSPPVTFKHNPKENFKKKINR